MEKSNISKKMKRRHFVILFLFLFLGIAMYVVANGEDKDKIGTIIENQKEKVVEAIKKNGSVVLGKTQEKASEIYEVAKEKGGEVLQSAIVTPSQEIAKDLVKAALINASSILTPEDIEVILVKKEGKTTCECK